MIEKVPAGIWWSLVVVGSAAITVVSSLPGGAGGGIQLGGFDKIVHAGVFGVWAAVFLAALTRSFPGLRFSRRAGLTVLAAILFGVSDELHQSTVPGRHADVFDLLSDSLGAVAAVGLWRLVLDRPGAGAPPGEGAGAGGAPRKD